MSECNHNKLNSEEEGRLVNELKNHFEYEEYESKLQGTVIELERVNVNELIKVLQPYLK